MHNVSFTTDMLDSGAAWMKNAISENYQYSMAMKEVEQQLSKTGNVQHVNMAGETIHDPSAGVVCGVVHFKCSETLTPARVTGVLCVGVVTCR